MKEYFEATIEEQIERGLYLKKMIPFPTKYAELSSLADRCGRIIDNTISELRFLKTELNNNYNDNIRFVLREFRRCTRELELVESFGISPLNYQSGEMGYLNKLAFKIHQEINYPLSHPSIACLSTQYYFYHPFTSVIFVPFGESDFLLHIPDIFHELGHGVLLNLDNDLKLEKLKISYDSVLSEITKYYQDLLTSKKRETGPKEDIIYLIKLIHGDWKNYWLNEFLCDLFALFTLGPSFAYSHIHLCTKKSKDIFEFSDILPQSHPSDDARMQMLTIGLNLLGFPKESKEILSKWNLMPYVVSAEPPVQYHYAFPKELMSKIADIFLTALNKSNFTIITPAALKTLPEKSICKLLNDAWDIFWKNPSLYRKWEKEKVADLKNGLYFRS